MVDQPAFIGVGETIGNLAEWYPTDGDHLCVVVAEYSAGSFEEVVVNSLVHPSAFRDEPEVDGSKRRQEPTTDPGFLLHLTDGRILEAFARFDVTLRQ